MMDIEYGVISFSCGFFGILIESYLEDALLKDFMMKSFGFSLICFLSKGLFYVFMQIFFYIW